MVYQIIRSGGGGGHGGGGHSHGGNLNEADLGNKISLSKINDLQISPNPSNGKFVVNVLLEETSEKVFIRIRNLDGRKVYQETAFVNGKSLNSTIDLSELASGVYFVSIQTGEEVITKKIVIE